MSYEKLTLSVPAARSKVREDIGFFTAQNDKANSTLRAKVYLRLEISERRAFTWCMVSQEELKIDRECFSFVLDIVHCV